MNVLIVEDEKSLAYEIASFLKTEGFLCELAFTGLEASEKIAVNLYDFVLLDLGLPDYNGLDLIVEARSNGNDTAFVIITARGSVQDKVKGLDLGADDYLAKPFALMELYSRIQAIARRKFNILNQNLKVGEFVLELQSRKMTWKGNEVIITKKEYDLLIFFLSNKDRVLTKEAIAEHLWGDEMDTADSFDFIYTHIKNLRRKIMEKGGEDYIRTIYGMGYKFTASV